MGERIGALRFLVTGGAGFIGSHVVDALVERGASVTVADNFSTGTADNLASAAGRIGVERIDFARGDPSALIKEGRFDTIVHTAGNASIPLSVSEPRRDAEDNALATQNLLEAVRRHSPETAVVNISSAAVYGEGHGVPIKEDDPKLPIAPYGVSKLAADHYAAVYSRLFGVRTSTVRIFSTFGPRLRKQVVWDFMSRLAENPARLVIHGDGNERRDLNHISNVVEAILLVAEKAPMTGEAYNVGSRESVTITELAQDLAAALGFAPEIHRTMQDRPGQVKVWQADITKLESLGYSERVSYMHGIAATVSWFESEMRK